jgi:hypothetical protein
MEEEAMEQCEHCRFWKRLEQSEKPHGYCRRYAPRPFGVARISDAGEWYDRAIWPTTADGDWCGEWGESRTVSSLGF